MLLILCLSLSTDYRGVALKLTGSVTLLYIEHTINVTQFPFLMWDSKLTKSDDTQRSTLSTITKLPLFDYFQSTNSYSVLAGTLRLVLHGTLKGLYKIDFSIKAYVVSYFVFNKLVVNGFMGNKYTISYTQSFRGTKKRDASVGTEITLSILVI